MAGGTGFEPMTISLTANRSTTELTTHILSLVLSTALRLGTLHIIYRLNLKLSIEFGETGGVAPPLFPAYYLRVSFGGM